ncbi:MAG: SIMPL domain-containing protein [Selenomonadaceae bacterium]|nr:SIMPL domain-containing protein [Selenomonadaceae bacterium]
MKFLILAMILIFGFSSTAAAEERIPTISVSGEGTIEVAPDRATISVGVVTRDKNASKVQADNSRIANEIIKSVSALGIDKKNIRTGNYSFYPYYRQDNNRRIADGYEANNTVTVIVDDLNLVGKVIDAALSHGANQIDSLEFGIKNKSNLQNEAIRLAVRDARAKAEVVAAELGKNIIGVRSVSVNSGYISAPRANKMFMEEMAMDGAGATPIESGTLTCSASVHVEFEMN